MARPRKPLDALKQSALVLKRWESERAGPSRERLHAVKLGLEGKLDLEAIARAVGRARSVIQEWFDRYRRGGLAELLEVRHGQGPPSRLSAADEAFLRAGLQEGKWCTAGENLQRRELNWNQAVSSLCCGVVNLNCHSPSLLNSPNSRNLCVGRMKFSFMGNLNELLANRMLPLVPMM